MTTPPTPHQPDPAAETTAPYGTGASAAGSSSARSASSSSTALAGEREMSWTAAEGGRDVDMWRP